MASAFSFDVSHSQGFGFKLYAYLRSFKIILDLCAKIDTN